VKNSWRRRGGSRRRRGALLRCSSLKNGLAAASCYGGACLAPPVALPVRGATSLCRTRARRWQHSAATTLTWRGAAAYWACGEKRRWKTTVSVAAAAHSGVGSKLACLRHAKASALFYPLSATYYHQVGAGASRRGGERQRRRAGR
jgi:hypothetical protein